MLCWTTPLQKQKASESLNLNPSQAGPDGLLNDQRKPSQGLSHFSHTNKERISSLTFSAPSPAPGVTHALVIHPPLNHGWEGVVDIMNHGTAGFFFLFAEEGEGRLHCFVPKLLNRSAAHLIDF